MTILRLAVGAEESIRNKIYGFCNFDDALEMELKKCEKPNHFEFFNKKAWNHIREFVRSRISEFVLEITPKKEKIEVASDILQKAVKLVNDLVGEYAPELLGGIVKRPVPPPPPPPPVRIDVFRTAQRKYDYNETLEIYCEVANDTEENISLQFRMAISHHSGAEKHKSRFALEIPGRSIKKIDIPLIDFNEGTDKRGKYLCEGILHEKQRGDLHKRSFTFYLDEEPPVPPPGPGEHGHAFVSGFEFLKGKKTDGTMQFFAKWKTLPIETSRKGILHVIWDHADFMRMRELASSKRDRNRGILLYCAHCSISEAYRRLLEHRYSDNRLDPEEIRRIKNLCDEMIYESIMRTE